MRTTGRTITSLSWIASLAISICACGDSSPADGGGGTNAGGSNAGGDAMGGAAEGGAGQGGSGFGGMTTEDFVAGGDRPVTVRVPTGYDGSEPAPLLILLHGYASNSVDQDSYLVIGPVAAAKGVIFAAPEGTVDEGGAQFWNATDACCNFGNLPVDDSAYLIGLVDEIEARLNVDPTRVYFVGHSNGGYMSYRMACDHADRITAVVSLAGAMWTDPAQCGATEPVSVLEIHGTADVDVAYDGGVNGGSGVAYPGVAETVGQWVTIDGCDDIPTEVAPRDLDVNLAGAETTVDTYSGCDATTEIQLWTIEGGDHVPALVPEFGDQVVDWLLTRSK